MPAIVEASPRAAKLRPNEDLVLETITQVEQRVPALAGKLRTWVHRADCGDPVFALLKQAIVRIGRRTWISRTHFNDFLNAYRGAPPVPPNNPNPGEHLRKKTKGRA